LNHCRWLQPPRDPPTVRLSTIADAKTRFVEAGRQALASYDDMHRVLPPASLSSRRSLEKERCRSAKLLVGSIVMCRPFIMT
jgi:hypothetical protein